MNADTGRFENLDFLPQDRREKRLVELKEHRMRLNPQYALGHQQDPTLFVGEVVEIKGIRFRVTRIKSDGKLGLKMLKDGVGVEGETQ